MLQVTHGDMKAQNVLITGRWAKITDVGVARVMAAPEQSNTVVTRACSALILLDLHCMSLVHACKALLLRQRHAHKRKVRCSALEETWSVIVYCDALQWGRLHMPHRRCFSARTGTRR